MFPDYSLNNVNCSTKIFKDGRNFDIDLIQLSMSKWGFASKNCLWRIMYYDSDFSAYVFNNGRVNLFCKTVNIDEIKRYVENMMDVRDGEDGVVISSSIANIVIHFDMGTTINLDLNFTSGYTDDIFDFINDSSCGDSGHTGGAVKILDRQSHPGLRITPFLSQNIGITVYPCGKITAYGMKSTKDIDRVKDYISNNIILG